ncbi:uncharacterized protein LAESUDRAFT_815938 [Laetiporus sulphureus 93-53]|uniref:F-box domain-containing protein n=1 Tax=Laetiporus sulphureus 93-53 TaxID=1314785 RepID=A0A165BMN0_9APHY|nr:uncharacterized protein LAESUDRAFT_815938 [Laetiporus sulphureus 93-53]KZT01317.1 hypothetical protein LAESUDRAFT_815938 [Laetiporus sulphureus 93-53]
MSPKQVYTHLISCEMTPTLNTLHAQLKFLETTFLSWLATVRSSTNINRLPVEILELIFAHVPEPFELFPEEKHASPWSYGVLDICQLGPAMLVCRHWRNVIIANQALWGHISSQRQPALQRVLRGSGVSPLHVAVSGAIGKTLSRTFRDTPARLRELHVHDVDLTELASSLTFPAPELRSLTISKTSHCGYDNPNDAKASILFQGAAPALQFLWLRDADIYLNFHLPNLTHLTLTACHGASRLLPFLSNTPNLVHLAISEPVSASIPQLESPPISELVALPKLRCFALHTSRDVSKVGGLILSHLVLGADVAAYIKYAAKWHRPHIQALSRWSVTASVTRVSVVVGDYGYQGIRIQAVGPSGSICLEQGVLEQDTWVEDLTTLFSSAHIQELWLSERWEEQPTPLLKTLLRRAPHLERLVLNVEQVDELVDAPTVDDPVCLGRSITYVLPFDVVRRELEKSKLVLQRLVDARERLRTPEVTLVFCVDNDEAEQDARAILEGFETPVRYVVTQTPPRMTMPSTCPVPEYPCHAWSMRSK